MVGRDRGRRSRPAAHSSPQPRSSTTSISCLLTSLTPHRFPPPSGGPALQPPPNSSGPWAPTAPSRCRPRGPGRHAADWRRPHARTAPLSEELRAACAPLSSGFIDCRLRRADRRLPARLRPRPRHCCAGQRRLHPLRGWGAAVAGAGGLRHALLGPKLRLRQGPRRLSPLPAARPWRQFDLTPEASQLAGTRPSRREAPGLTCSGGCSRRGRRRRGSPADQVGP